MILTIRRQPVTYLRRPAGAVIVFQSTRSVGQLTCVLECQVFSDN